MGALKHDMPPLRKCPFYCYSYAFKTVVIPGLQSWGRVSYAVECMHCKSRGPLAPSPQTAWRDWNDRMEILDNITVNRGNI